jgi:hypothetical protein
MALRAHLARVVATLFVAGLAPACGGKTLGGSGGNAEPGDDSGVSTDSGIGTGATGGSGAGCVDLEVAPSDLSCESDQDCELVRTGQICNGQCSCGDTPVNAAAGERFQTDTASLTLEACPCADPGEARCLGGQCTLCAAGSTEPAGCGASGITTIEEGGIEEGGISFTDGGEFDSGITDADGTTCVFIVLSTYDTSCNQSADCIVLPNGWVCSGECACGGWPVNASGRSIYEQAIGDITPAACPCPSEVAPSCFENKCIFPLVLPGDP